MTASHYLNNASSFHPFGVTTRWIDRQLYGKRYELQYATILLCLRESSERALRDQLRFAESNAWELRELNKKWWMEANDHIASNSTEELLVERHLVY